MYLTVGLEGGKRRLLGDMGILGKHLSDSCSMAQSVLAVLWTVEAQVDLTVL